MNEGIVLMIENRKERPRNRDGSREVTFWGGECVCGSSALKEESRDANKLAKSCTDENAYSPRKTKTFVHTPGGCFAAFVPKASNAVRITRTVVQPCQSEKGRCTKISSKLLDGEWNFLTM